jgi:hypothetical protein
VHTNGTVHEREEITTHTAEMWGDHGHRSVRCDGSINRVTAERQHVGTRLGSDTVGAGDYSVARMCARTHVVAGSLA